MNYEGVVVEKPWGYEHLIYQNSSLGIWYLRLMGFARTSLHAHPNKKTGLVVLDGEAEVSFMNGSHRLFPSDKIIIRQGVFHSTAALSPGGLQLLEVETPNDKEDIVRLEDAYGREGTGYEGPDHYANLANGNHLMLGQSTSIGKCILTKVHIDGVEDLKGRGKSKLLILEGQVYYKTFCICGPGDIVDNVTLDRFANKFDATPISGLEIRLGT